MIRPQRNAFRDFIDLSGIWRIRFDPDGAGEAQGWSRGFDGGFAIATPGSWNEQLAEAGFMDYTGAAWLQTRVHVPLGFAGKRLRLRFGSADFQADVWVNGEWAGGSDRAFLPFEAGLDGQFVPGEEALIVVRVDGRLPEQGPTQRVTLEDYAKERRPKDEYLPAVRFDFFPYGGINRPAYLVATPPAAVSRVKVDPVLDESEGGFRIEASAEPSISAVSIEAQCGATTLRGQATVVDGRAVVVLTTSSCPVWSVEAPNLFEIRIEALDAHGSAVDRVSLRSGVRTVEVKGAQLLLNGAPVVLRGFGRHEDSPFRGRGLDLAQLVKDFHLMRWCGANSVRTSHYPYAEEFYDLCDENGILVIDEVFSINLDFRKVRSEGLEKHKEAIAALVTRDYNHPCVIAWSLANEPGYLGEPEYREQSAPYWRELFSFARSLDFLRPMTHANVQYAGIDDPAFVEADFLMINRYYGWYSVPGQLERAVELLQADFDQLAGSHGKPIFVSEFGADALSGAHSITPQLFTEDYQAAFIDAYWKAIEAHPSVIGGHVWNFADFRTAQHARRVVFNLKGVFTRDRTPKAAAHLLRRLWT